VVKRLFDVVLTALALVACLPILFVAALGIRLSSPGPVLYRAVRAGRRGRLFTMYKLRTMETRPQLVPDSVITAAHDPRVFPFGALLRRAKLDELPQLFNVLRGDMSLVGPRPWPTEMVRRQVAEGRDYRNRIPAGLTGPAQVTKGEGIRYEDLDLRYVEAWSSLSSWALVRYDLQILRQTLAVIARGEGLNF